MAKFTTTEQVAEKVADAIGNAVESALPFGQSQDQGSNNSVGDQFTKDSKEAADEFMKDVREAFGLGESKDEKSVSKGKEDYEHER